MSRRTEERNPYVGSSAWRAIDTQFETLSAGRRASALAVVGGAGATHEHFIKALVRESRSRGFGWIGLGLVGGHPIAAYLGRPVHNLLTALQAKRPGLPMLGAALAESSKFVEMWSLVVWPRTGVLPSRLSTELERDVRDLTQALIAALDATRAQAVVHLSNFSEVSMMGRDLLTTFNERRGTSASMVIASLLPGTPVSGGFTEVPLASMELADARVSLGDLSDEVADRVLKACDGQRWILREFVQRRSELASPPFSTLAPEEAELELIEFWAYLSRTAFQPLASELEPPERRILLAIAGHGDGTLDQDQLIRAVGDTNRFDSSSSFLADHLASLLKREFVQIDGDGRLHARKPGLATYLRRS